MMDLLATLFGALCVVVMGVDGDVAAIRSLARMADPLAVIPLGTSLLIVNVAVTALTCAVVAVAWEDR